MNKKSMNKKNMNKKNMNKGYIGRIPNSGNMDVKAPQQMKPAHKAMVVKSGEDLRGGEDTGKRGKKREK